MTNLNTPQLIEAVRLWTGWGITPAPSPDDARLKKRYGDAVASTLLPLIKSLEDDFYSSDARITAKDLAEMGDVAIRDFKEKHPGVADEIAQALAWCCTFDYK